MCLKDFVDLEKTPVYDRHSPPTGPRIREPASESLSSPSSRKEETSHNHPARTLEPTSVPWHLYRTHTPCFGGRIFSRASLDEMKIFRDSVIRLPEREIEEIITAIQTVRCHIFPVFYGPLLSKLVPLQCIDGCLMGTKSTNQRLRLLQDISLSAGLLPRPYWVSDVIKAQRISVGGEATLYLGHHRGEGIVVREFHPVGPSRSTEPEMKRVKAVSSFHMHIANIFLSDECL